MAQETGILVAWLKHPGEPVEKGEPVMEIETDKATVEIEAPASGTLEGVRAQAGDEVPVGQVVAWILNPGEDVPQSEYTLDREAQSRQESGKTATPVIASPVARRMAEENQVDLSSVKSDGGRIRKADVQAFLEQQATSRPATRLTPASPKARRLAGELGIDLDGLAGSGPEGVVLAADVLSASEPVATQIPAHPTQPATSVQALSSVWRVMTERVTHSWTSVPHFYLIREANASRLQAWRERAQASSGRRITYTDLLVKLTAAALMRHPALNAIWKDGTVLRIEETNIGLAVAVEDGLVVPVIHQADRLSLSEIAERSEDLVQRARARKLRPQDLENGTFTISNLGMFGVDAFNAIVNTPQAAILSVGRIAERVVPVNGQVSIQPMLMISLSCDHRVVDGARAAQFIGTLADLIEEPLGLIQ
jgi:pyruvate dehydrogenase E2 component (dihydrolipoamide acetyltransferase)